MGQRTNKTYSLPSGKRVVLNDYITGREYEAIQAEYTRDAEVKIADGKATINKFNLNGETLALHKLLEFMVVSVDEAGEGQAILDIILDLPKEDYQFVIDTVNEITGKKSLAHREHLKNYMKDQLSGDFLIAEICREYGWTYSEYMDAPRSFIESILEKMKIDAQKSKLAAKK